jgi:hypothetical protein
VYVREITQWPAACIAQNGITSARKKAKLIPLFVNYVVAKKQCKWETHNNRMCRKKHLDTDFIQVMQKNKKLCEELMLTFLQNVKFIW